ncbi:MAG: hypothetical protein IMY71_06860 [Bacteroidetes bacterium]|nr:hypothetical protein [Bacteroidota bacterium]
MKIIDIFYVFGLLIILAAFTSCAPGNGQKKNNLVMEKGTFGYDMNFLEKKGGMIVLSGNEDKAQVIVSPEYQGKVFTSTAEGLKGKSFGWINYNLLESDTILDHMNAYGGEDRLWIGPEGGQFSIFFKPGGGMNIDNWFTPAPIDTEPWELISKSQNKVEMEKMMTLMNYSGTEFNLHINRSITLFNTKRATDLLGIEIPGNVNWVGYGSENKLTNTGDHAWTKKTGTLSIWMLSMFSPGDHITVVVPFHKGDEKELGPVATTDYFGEITSERIKYSDNVIFFRVDGNKRRKLGLTPLRAKPVAGSYDAENNVLTIVKYSIPDGEKEYINQLWKWQENPFSGDVINAYNDGPLENGSQMGPFYEIESSSPAAFLEKGESIIHHHMVFHFTGPEDLLNGLSSNILGVTLDEIKHAW